MFNYIIRSIFQLTFIREHTKQALRPLKSLGIVSKVILGLICSLLSTENYIIEDLFTLIIKTEFGF